jgi:hypothetical protein
VFDNKCIKEEADVNSGQRRFFEAELFQLTLGAVTQRGGVYMPKLDEKTRRPLHKTLREVLHDLLPSYAASEVAEAAHMANIAALERAVTDKHSGILRDGKFRTGSAQKARNLHLKYYWCLGNARKPPHCPFDLYVLSKIPEWKGRSWIAISSPEDYAMLVADARRVAGSLALADWELSVYNEATAAP